MSFSFNLNMGPRGAIRQLGKDAEEGRFLDRRVITGMLAFLKIVRNP